MTLSDSVCLEYNGTVKRDRAYWMRLARFAAVALLLGLVTAYAGSAVLGGALYAHALTHPGCGDTGLTPVDVGIPDAQDVTYQTQPRGSTGSLTLRAWYLPPENGVVIILLPGLGGGRDGMLREGGILARHGYGLLLTELRSCAHPRGQTTVGYYESEDLADAVTWVLEQPQVEHVGVLGYSLGGVAATLGAAKDKRIEAVVAEGGFYDLAADMVNEGEKKTLWETILYQSILVFFRLETGVSARDISPISVIDHISPRPLFLIYGEMEVGETRPSAQLMRAGEPKDLWVVPGAWHGGYLDVAAEEWEQRVVTFFDTAFAVQHHE
jgi:dipeptidyl aminopeptidase/acylaminoacyl peptidase